MPKISDERKTERREQILASARRCFAEHGYEGATVVRLEEATGLSRGAIFNYFGSKEDLFIELAVEDTARMSELWVNEGLEAVVREIVELDPDWLGVYLELIQRVRTDPEFRRRIEERQKDVIPVNRATGGGGAALGRVPRRPRAERDRDVREPRAQRARAPARRRETSRRAWSSSSTCSRTLSEAELGRIRVRVHVPEAHDLGDVAPRLGERDPRPVLAPAIDVPLARVVGGEHELRVLVALAQVVEVPGAVADVDLGVAQIVDDEAVAARAESDPLRGVRAGAA